MRDGVTIVIVTYNSGQVIGRCLESCRRWAPGAQVLVVDNGSLDDTVQVARSFESVEVTANGENRGFAGAVNQAAELAGMSRILLLNPDAELLTDLSTLSRALDDARIGAAGGHLVGPEGNPQNGFEVRGFPTALTLAFESLGINRLAPWNPVNRRYRIRAAGGDVDQPAGAFLMIRRDAFDAVGGFDERFWPIWFEDVDFARRLHAAGFRIIHVPECRARHLGGHSLYSVSWSVRQECWYGSLLRYAGKHFGAVGRTVVGFSVLGAAVPRAMLGSLRERSTEPFGAFGRVARRAAGCLIGGAADATSGESRRAALVAAVCEGNRAGSNGGRKH